MKKVLITGGNSGLGFEITKILLSRDYQVTILGKDREKLDRAEKKLDSKNLSVIQCDLRKYDQIHKSLKPIKDLDILINCAGIVTYEKLEDHDPQNIKDIVNTNLLGPIFVTRELLPIFKEKNSGIIMNVSSTSGLMTGGHPEECAYVASKYGVTGFTETLKKEMEAEGKNVRVLGFYPGGMNTEFWDNSEKDCSKFMDPKEIAEIVVFIIERPEGIKIDHVVVNRNK